MKSALLDGCYSLYRCSLGWGAVVADAGGLVAALLPFGEQTKEAIKSDIAGHWPEIGEGSGTAAQAATLLAAYFAGEKVSFDLPIDQSRFTEFQREVYAAVSAIPYGSVRSYVEVAAAIGRPAAARGVGVAMATNRLPIIIPCHRVIAKSGHLTGYSATGGLDSKSWLLKLEGVELCDKFRVHRSLQL